MAWVDERLRNIERYSDDWIGVVDSTRFGLFEELSRLILDMETTGGNIARNMANMARINAIIQAMDDYLFTGEADYLQGLTAYVRGLGTTALLANRALKIEQTPILKSILENLQLNTIRLFDKTAVDAVLTQSIRTTLLNAVSGQASTINTVQTIRNLVVGDAEREGLLKRYAKTWALTGFASAERQYVFTVAEEAGATLYEYSGGTVKDSREFCLERVGNTYTKEEVQDWADLEWQGKTYGTDRETIFSYCGGYNCMHVLSPVLP